MGTLFISHSAQQTDWAIRLEDALRTKGIESVFVAAHPERGIHVGANWEKELWAKLRQSRGVVVLCTADWLNSPWCVAEAMIARERGKPVFLMVAPDVADERQLTKKGDPAARATLPSFLKDTQWISLRNQSEDDAIRLLLIGLSAEHIVDQYTLPKRPYVGLDRFEESDAAVYFGRDMDIQTVTDTLGRRHRGNGPGFILILGASGSGKSSLIRAGVLPRLRQPHSATRTTDAWHVFPPIMASDGIEGLLHSLTSASAIEHFIDQDDISLLRVPFEKRTDNPDWLEATGKELTDVANRLSKQIGNVRILFVLDQLEEVFGTPSPSSARDNLRLLLHVTANSESNIAVVATMRSDFLNEFQLFPAASGNYDKITLDPLPRSRFGEIIVEPAKQFNLELEPSLVTELIADTLYDDALPLLSFTLEKLFADFGRRCSLKLDYYKSLFPPVTVWEHGHRTEYRGVSAAIRHAADKILDRHGCRRLAADDPVLRDIRRVFHKLTHIGAGGQFARRIAQWEDVPDSCKPIFADLVKERLLVYGTDRDGRPTLAVAHEALFRVWDTLRGWLEQDRQAIALLHRVEDAAIEWRTRGKDQEHMWSDRRILEAILDIEKSGISVENAHDPQLIREFVGPTNKELLAKLPSLGRRADQQRGSGRYGDFWRLPLGHAARASVGVRLALLGDERPGVGLRADGLPDVDWLPISGGDVTIEIRSDPDEPLSEVQEFVTRRIEPFWMSRYPVTVIQFEAFLKECYRDGKWHLPNGWFFDVPDAYPAPVPRTQYGNHPADSIAWIDASMYCHWLSSRMGLDIHLPSEFQWVQAACNGNSENAYPWGKRWNASKANTRESGLHRSTAVGMYPAGASYGGVQDMAGMVWEWCENWFDEPDRKDFPEGGGDLRVKRGGAWNIGAKFALTSYRNRAARITQHYYFGFRIACSSPPQASSA